MTKTGDACPVWLKTWIAVVWVTWDQSDQARKHLQEQSISITWLIVSYTQPGIELCETVSINMSSTLWYHRPDWSWSGNPAFHVWQVSTPRDCRHIASCKHSYYSCVKQVIFLPWFVRLWADKTTQKLRINFHIFTYGKPWNKRRSIRFFCGNLYLNQSPNKDFSCYLILINGA